ncbi:MAG: hypothetical protein IKH73_02205 [Erysipelotrichaceae bacterium]|nr:hypothetical protein [Erysipelotrichaceae bacterium]
MIGRIEENTIVRQKKRLISLANSMEDLSASLNELMGLESEIGEKLGYFREDYGREILEEQLVQLRENHTETLKYVIKTINELEELEDKYNAALDELSKK